MMRDGCLLTCLLAALLSVVLRTPADAETPKELPPVPEAVTSFGAAVAGDFVYVYGGHIGRAHQHSVKNLSSTFARLNLREPHKWERLPMGPQVQGLALVAQQGKLYRIGGMQPRNAPDVEDDLYSLRSVSRFDPAAGKWKDLPPLPQGRSSHDAVVVGDRIYVVGGWELKKNASKAVWHDDLLMLDLGQKQLAWKTVSQTPFHRRALAVAASGGKLYVLGGLSQDGELSQRVDVFDLAGGQWSRGPNLPQGDKKGNGFGISAYGWQGTVWACGMDGNLYRLSSQGDAWQAAGKLETPRFFHRLLPADRQTLLAIAGAGWGTGHLKDIEVLQIPAKSE